MIGNFDGGYSVPDQTLDKLFRESRRVMTRATFKITNHDEQEQHND